MLNGAYYKVNKAHARAALITKPDMMDASSGMGDAEIIDGIGVRLKAAAPVQKPKITDIKTMDDVIYDGNGSQVKPDQFPKSYYMGENDYGI